MSRGDRAQDPPPGPAGHPGAALAPQDGPVDGGPHLLKISSSGKTAFKSHKRGLWVSIEYEGLKWKV